MATDETIDRAAALRARGRFREAEVVYRDLLHARPETLAALEGLGILVFQQGKVDEAASLFARGLAIRPDSARFHAYLGEALRQLKQFDQAQHHLRRGLTLDPTMSHAWNSLGILAYDQGRFAAAEAAYREAIRLSRTPRWRTTIWAMPFRPVDDGAKRPRPCAPPCGSTRITPRRITNLGQVLCEMGDPNVLVEAESICRRAVAVAPRLPHASENLGNLLRLQGRFDEAMACYGTALKQDPRGRCRSC